MPAIRVVGQERPSTKSLKQSLIGPLSSNAAKPIHTTYLFLLSLWEGRESEPGLAWLGVSGLSFLPTALYRIKQPDARRYALQGMRRGDEQTRILKLWLSLLA